MATGIFSQDVMQALQSMQRAALQKETRKVEVDGHARQIPYPFPSPADWRDYWIYFLMLDRFNNPAARPLSTGANPPIAWNQQYGYRQGGTFKGVQQQLGYLASLGVKAIWISPVLKNPKPPGWEYNYHGYATQDFLNVDERFASDGTRAPAERELTELVDEAHARGLAVIFDIVLNHAARVFDYQIGSQTESFVQDPNIMNAPLGQEPPIEWLNGLGFPRADWANNLPPSAALSPDDAVWPTDLQRDVFFRRRGNRLSDQVGPGGFVRGDFSEVRQLVAEYDAQPPSQQALRVV
jgi:hypothetical protein